MVKQLKILVKCLDIKLTLKANIILRPLCHDEKGFVQKELTCELMEGTFYHMQQPGKIIPKYWKEQHSIFQKNLILLPAMTTNLAQHFKRDTLLRISDWETKLGE